ncbi:M20/M25/M40 family metallo-hydrolase [Brucella sp. ZJ1_1]|uniref:Carboxypeptidase G2 n=2 Tax=Brucella intermedia TaxID=94625 RepID=C4WPP5_9HYPH|nr:MULTISPECIES: M20/M25/M40 family metallo-hydrolase [Brucella/Ochrobactrum group]KAB2668448.1 M20/M25/M40 family metallo-hydrolase [Ochrobactrum sp. LMG 5442]EEQ94152.1 Carboxypeptidase G2 precursor [Brucella intermedia LMG 3301]ELT46576.1 carboxypeptidase [Brucella intermedia M86]MBB3217004.1 glutamate carboxypeptidase [Ochrobactrum sp. RC6B]MCO7737783.1 M20/M25/M40 family metallo-hydrolase [Brucella intermedia]
MSAHELPFDLNEMIARLRPWIETESPTFDAAAVNRLVDTAAYDFAAAGASVEFIPGRMGFGGSLRARFPHADQGRPGILVSGHLDTVHPLGVINVNPYRREDGKIYGPGIQDMKGGNFVALEAMRQIARSGLTTKLPVTFLLTPDEEVGTPSTRDLIEQEALKNKYVLVPEPARRDGGAVVGRYAIARYNLETIGRPSHAGWLLKEGRSAIRRMSEKILEIEALTTDDCTFSVGVIHAGQWVNCVSSSCKAEALSMAKTQRDLEEGVSRILALAGVKDDVEFIVTRGVTRPVWEHGQPQDMELFNFANDIAKEIGFTMTAQSSGGGSDGNFTGALGVPTLDSIGVRGEGLHTLGEHIFEDSLIERARLHAGLFLRLN